MIQPNNYIQILEALKEKIRSTRYKVAMAANFELLKLYWEIGNTILEQQKTEGWGTKIIDRLAADLKMDFPDFKGLSVRNLKYMRSFAKEYPGFATEYKIGQQPVAQLQSSENQLSIIGQQAAAQLPWGHHQVLLDKITSLWLTCRIDTYWYGFTLGNYNNNYPFHKKTLSRKIN